MTYREWVNDSYCFACGEKNPIGMHLHFETTGEKLQAKYVFPKELQGYSNTVHGGMISLLLDEVMVNLPWLKLKEPVVSADIRVKLKRPLKIGEPVTAQAWVDKQKRNIYRMKSRLIRDSDGAVVAEAEAVCFKINIEKI
ncbi:MAG: PaaI family thioesterase [Spirochaetia bacterium]|nr:PaaI family thioesterase [Spirochaetia bacterium]